MIFYLRLRLDYILWHQLDDSSPLVSYVAFSSWLNRLPSLQNNPCLNYLFILYCKLKFAERIV